MKIQVTVKLHSKQEGVVELDANHYCVSVKVAPVEGKANQRVIELLAKYLKRSKSSLELVAGHRSKRKYFKLHET